MSTADDDALSSFRRHHIGRALARAHWAFEQRFSREIRGRGFEDFRLADVDVIARLPHGEGARITDLAERAHITKQAIGKLVQGLVARGYVEKLPDPADGRAYRVVLSRRGLALLEASRAVIEEIEAEWAEFLSPGVLARMRRALLAIGDEFGPEEYL